jgi:hypothetical protein
VHHNEKSERQSGEWGSEANEWSLRASVEHSLAHVLCVPSRSSWTRHGRNLPSFLLASFDPFDLCRPYIETFPPTCCLSLFFTVDLSSSLPVAQSTARLLTAKGAIVEGSRRLPVIFCARAL